MPKPANKLSQELIDLLQGEKIVSLITLDHETKQPQLSAISWVVAHPGGETIKFAVGHNASSVRNMESNPEIILGVIGAGSYYAIKGTATVSGVIEKTIKLRVVTVKVKEVEDVMFYGGKVTAEPAYIKTYNADLAKRLDDEVYTLLREA